MTQEDLFQQTRATFQQLTAQLDRIGNLVEEGRARLLDLERQAALSGPNAEAFQAFMRKPYLLRPIKGDRYELIIPRFVDFRAGWPVRTEGEYVVFEVSRFIDLLSPLPDWLRTELGYEAPDFRAHLEGDRLIVTDGDPAQVWNRLGGSKTFTIRRGGELRVRPKSRFQLVRDLVRQGILPYTPRPVPDDILREPKVGFALRPEQARDFQKFLACGAVAVFATGGAGKTYFGMYAAAGMRGSKVILAPRRSILQQWQARMEAHCPAEVLDEVEFRTYQSVRRKPLKGSYSLIIYDEIQHLPADMGVAAAQADTLTRIGLSATPWRESGDEDLIPALCGFPVGFDWPSGETADTTVWIVNQGADKLDLVKSLVEKPVAGKTMIFVYRLKVGRKIAADLGVPFVSGQTQHQLRVMQESDTFVVSKVGDAGVSLDVARVIEVDFLGGRMEAGQRALRTRHAGSKGKLHLIMTRDEYHRHSKRLSALFALGFDVHMAAGGSDAPSRKPSPRKTQQRRPAKQEADRSDIPPAVANKIAQAEASVARPTYVGRVFTACSQASLSAQEIAEALGSTSASTVHRIRAAARALEAQGLLSVNGERYQVNDEEIKRLTALSSLGEMMR